MSKDMVVEHIKSIPNIMSNGNRSKTKNNVKKQEKGYILKYTFICVYTLIMYFIISLVVVTVINSEICLLYGISRPFSEPLLYQTNVFI